ncbi:SgcJ/EcaC family oxidoreductase [Ornithinimicrobium faecis]|uniref:SgcJ/EcaC family oxidoreductase n=1 Tax=Ornithinimicrobium faecis TaxID=2934158 RepID=A0ABY4YV59_9MICO|nr:SgcJ/EcaC family oxidoreductase [Ornithinimicrobium sp. HY1793]USQ80355.1 SgcJ/EcaC family oxidoreductase [Ornithinimicrobium sp. HY1793]
MPAHPEDVAHGFAQAWGRGDADAIAALFADDADFVNVVGFWWTRREQIRHNHAYGFEHIFPGSTMTIERQRVRDLGDTAVVHALWRIDGQRAPSTARRQADPGARRGIFTFVVHRGDDGAWLAVAAQNTDIVPGAQTLLADDSGLRPTRYD